MVSRLFSLAPSFLLLELYFASPWSPQPRGAPNFP